MRTARNVEWERWPEGTEPGYLKLWPLTCCKIVKAHMNKMKMVCMYPGLETIFNTAYLPTDVHMPICLPLVHTSDRAGEFWAKLHNYALGTSRLAQLRWF